MPVNPFLIFSIYLIPLKAVSGCFFEWGGGTGGGSQQWTCCRAEPSDLWQARMVKKQKPILCFLGGRKTALFYFLRETIANGFPWSLITPPSSRAVDIRHLRSWNSLVRLMEYWDILSKFICQNNRLLKLFIVHQRLCRIMNCWKFSQLVLNFIHQNY